jgi:hypothetical protein
MKVVQRPQTTYTNYKQSDPNWSAKIGYNDDNDSTLAQPVNPHRPSYSCS